MRSHAARVVALTTLALLFPFAIVLAYFTTDPVFSYAVNVTLAPGYQRRFEFDYVTP